MEVWKDVKGYEQFYEISNYGRLRSKERIVNNKVRKPRILKGSDNGNGYMKMMLNDGTKKERRYIHRMVAEAFIPNSLNKPFVNHIDNNPSNNNVKNLEWCTPKENSDWKQIQGRDKRTDEWISNLHKAQEKQYVAVIGVHIKSGLLLRFGKLNDVKIAGFEPSCVCDCCKGKRKTHKGYRWHYENSITK